MTARDLAEVLDHIKLVAPELFAYTSGRPTKIARVRELVPFTAPEAMVEHWLAVQFELNHLARGAFTSALTEKQQKTVVAIWTGRDT